MARPKRLPLKVLRSFPVLCLSSQSFLNLRSICGVLRGASISNIKYQEPNSGKDRHSFSQTGRVSSQPNTGTGTSLDPCSKEPRSDPTATINASPNHGPIEQCRRSSFNASRILGDPSPQSRYTAPCLGHPDEGLAKGEICALLCTNYYAVHP
jgi:hypothetical protein